jgi:hypothetical protein
MSRFFDEISLSKVEGEVEDVYNKGIHLYFPQVNISKPFSCDGFFETKVGENQKLLRLIIEYKFDEPFKEKHARAKVFVQVLFYVKRFEENGQILPNVILVGDINECFVFHANVLLKYLDENVDWSVAPSKAADLNPELVFKVMEDEEFNPFVHVVDKNFSFKVIADKIKDLTQNVIRYVRVTEHNIAVVFNHFTTRVLKDTKHISTNELVSIFIGVITDKTNNYKHPEKKNILISNHKEIKINGDAFDTFFKHFEKTYTPQENNKFTEISDRLIEDTNRRRKGEFYTPTIFVDYAHKLIEEQFGEDWKDKYVIWDCCWGTGNLTRDYHFEHLYASTLEKGELEIGNRYNTQATKFIFDFLNDPDDNLPENLLKDLREDKPIIFFINPPYGAATTKGNTSDNKKGISNTLIRNEMIINGMADASQNLYTQFLYKILVFKKCYNLSNISICLYSPSLYLSGTSFKTFRKFYLNNFKFLNGILFNGNHFSNVADNWGISFTIWKCGKTENESEFEHTLIDVSDGNGEIFEKNKKNIYNLDNNILASDWVREDVKKLKTFDSPQFTNPINIKTEGKTMRGRLVNNALGYFLCGGNNVDMNGHNVGLFSGTYSIANGVSIIHDNFLKCTSLFTARKLILKDWINSKDEYAKPNTEHEKYKEFETDGIIYSLFHTSSNQSSLRNIDYKGKKWDIKNEFFWLSKQEMIELANEYHNDDCYNHAKSSNERYVHKLLKDITLSDEAQAVLEKATELTRSSFKYRTVFNEDHPEYQVNNWDCGWYQIKAILKEYDDSGLKEFEKLYKALSDKMFPMVYELGFLKS